MEVVVHVVNVVFDALGLFFYNYSTLEDWVVGGDSDWACTFVALEGLDAAESEHEAAGSVDRVGTVSHGCELFGCVY